jgi:DNA-binding MarR family transcriptional regulator
MDDRQSPDAVADAGPAGEVSGPGPSWTAEPAPHAVPLDLGRPSPEAMADGELNQQITEMLTELIKHVHDLGHSIATELGLTRGEAIALFKLGAPMTMKELGLRVGCDPSFVTTIADELEKRGLARREPSLRDRRSKTIVLTSEGEAIRKRILDELAARTPWCITLDAAERRCLLGLMHKMLGPHDPGSTGAGSTVPDRTRPDHARR